MERPCDTCLQPRDVGDFGLDGDLLGTTCRFCVGKKGAAAARRARRAQLTTLENHRRKLIAALVKVDAEIAELRGRAVFDPGSEASFNTEPS